MKTDDFDYFLPEELIAQTPLKDRSSSRLLVVDRATEAIEDKHFTNILDYIKPGDALVLNETKVIPARIIGSKEETHGVVELLLLKELGDNTWECLARPQKRLHTGTRVFFGAEDKERPEDTAKLVATVLETLDEGITHVKFEYSGIFLEINPVPKKLIMKSKILIFKLPDCAIFRVLYHYTIFQKFSSDCICRCEIFVLLSNSSFLNL